MAARFSATKFIFSKPTTYKPLVHRNFTFVTMTSKQISKVNQEYEPKFQSVPEFIPKENKSSISYPDIHNEKKWNDDIVTDLLQKHALMAWGPTNPMIHNAIKTIRSADGVYLFDSDNKKYIDFSSQAMCVNLGHSMPAEIRSAINEQIDKVSYLYGDLAICETRSRLSSLLSTICPENINAFLFPSSGAEANECALRIARKYTGKKKILSRYKSYHGATLGALNITGDNRRWNVDNDAVGFIKIFDPYPMYFKWCDSGNEDKIAEKALNVLHEQILHENPNDIAAIFIEPITGTNGWLKPPIRYVQGLRALCDKYGILLVCDEVMAGFGRTGKMFSIEHFDGVQPDIITFAKGITGAFLPLSGVGVSDEIMKYFRNNPVGYGSTYQSHPISMACGYAVIKYIIDHGIVDHVKNMESVIANEMEQLINNSNNSVAQGRVHGMAGCIDVMDPKTMDIICSTNEVHPKMMELRTKLNENGMMTFVRGPIVHIAPPLISTPQDIEYGFSILQKSLKQVFHS
eukprot:98085_1